MIKKIKINKLVRDKTLLNFKNAEIEYKCDRVSKDQLKKLALLKLLEETNECITSKNKDHLIEELCDVWEVFSKILNLNGIPFSKIIENSSKKNKIRGAFNKNIYLNWIKIDENHEYYKKGYYKNYEEIDLDED